jgi:hypothetical protein
MVRYMSQYESVDGVLMEGWIPCLLIFMTDDNNGKGGGESLVEWRYFGLFEAMSLRSTQ